MYVCVCAHLFSMHMLVFFCYAKRIVWLYCSVFRLRHRGNQFCDSGLHDFNAVPRELVQPWYLSVCVYVCVCVCVSEREIEAKCAK